MKRIPLTWERIEAGHYVLARWGAPDTLAGSVCCEHKKWHAERTEPSGDVHEAQFGTLLEAKRWVEARRSKR